MQIKNRFSSNVIFEDQTSGITQREILEKAAISGANLYGANLRSADLRGADLCGANLYGANLRSADLCGANLYGANLRSADLRSANLYGANLRSADLRSANLYGANLYGVNLHGADLCGANFEKGKLVGVRPYFSIQNIGSRSDTLELFLTDSGAFVRTGCFFDSIEVFKESVKETHNNNNHAQEYAVAIMMFEMHIKLWTPVE